MPQYQQKTKFPGVYSDKDGKYFLQTEFSRDRVTGKRIRKKSRVDQYGFRTRMLRKKSILSVQSFIGVTRF